VCVCGCKSSTKVCVTNIRATLYLSTSFSSPTHLRISSITQTLDGHTDVVLCVAAHPTRNILASGSLDKDRTVRMWEDSDASAAMHRVAAPQSQQAPVPGSGSGSSSSSAVGGVGGGAMGGGGGAAGGGMGGGGGGGGGFGGGAAGGGGGGFKTEAPGAGVPGSFPPQ
jgi:hypothetical protein